ncbi:MAG TPA: hypothetical protein VHA52_07920, partial [Candidatus Babeliaceae bacterium]|nr:hypothetical protein [Candidatus Babeliaceae bacterium]
TGLTVIMVSHDPAEVLSMADELIVLKDGEILEHGHPKHLYRYPQHLYTARLLTNCNVLTREEAHLCGIAAQKDHVVIYPEWAEPTASLTRKHWAVKQILFKGFFEELVLEQEGVELRALNSRAEKYAEGDMVHVKFKKLLEY